MRHEKSCGALVYRVKDGKTQFLILRHQAGHWSFPKGHVEAGETEAQTAQREIGEETGLTVSIDQNLRLVTQYHPELGVKKEVVYFTAQADPEADLTLQTKEIKASRWLPYREALQRLSYESDRKLLDKVWSYLLRKV